MGVLLKDRVMLVLVIAASVCVQINNECKFKPCKSVCILCVLFGRLMVAGGGFWSGSSIAYRFCPSIESYIARIDKVSFSPRIVECPGACASWKAWRSSVAGPVFFFFLSASVVRRPPPRYMPPEVAHGHPCHRRLTDQAARIKPTLAFANFFPFVVKLHFLPRLCFTWRRHVARQSDPPSEQCRCWNSDRQLH